MKTDSTHSASFFLTVGFKARRDKGAGNTAAGSVKVVFDKEKLQSHI